MQFPKGRDQVSGGVSVPCRLAIPVADTLWKEIFRKTSIRGASPAISYKLRNKDAIGGRSWDIAIQERKICDMEIETVMFVISIIVIRHVSVKLTVPPDRQK